MLLPPSGSSLSLDRIREALGLIPAVFRDTPQFVSERLGHAAALNVERLVLEHGLAGAIFLAQVANAQRPVEFATGRFRLLKELRGGLRPEPNHLHRTYIYESC